MKNKQIIRLLEVYRQELYKADESIDFKERTCPNDVDYDGWLNIKNEAVDPVLKAINNAIDTTITRLKKD